MCDFKSLSACELFTDLKHEEIEYILERTQSYVKHYEKGDIIISEGDKTEYFNVVISGSAMIYQNDDSGNAYINLKLERSEYFSQTYATTGRASFVSIIALQKSEILFINYQKVLKNFGSTVFQKFISNIITCISNRNYQLNIKIAILNSKSIKVRIYKFLSQYMDDEIDCYFEVPLNKQQMAEYLAVNRSALSKELGNLKRSKKLDFDGNNYKILDHNYFKELL